MSSVVVEICLGLEVRIDLLETFKAVTCEVWEPAIFDKSFIGHTKLFLACLFVDPGIIDLVQIVLRPFVARITGVWVELRSAHHAVKLLIGIIYFACDILGKILHVLCVHLNHLF